MKEIPRRCRTDKAYKGSRLHVNIARMFSLCKESSSGLYKKSDQKDYVGCNVSVRRLSSLLGLAALACLFNLRRLGNNSRHTYYTIARCQAEGIPRRAVLLG